MAWDSEIYLVKEIPAEVNDNGFRVPAAEEKNLVFADEKSVGYREFYESQQAGMKAEKKYLVKKFDYSGETMVEEISGKRFLITRTYEVENECVELTLTDLPCGFPKNNPDIGG